MVKLWFKIVKGVNIIDQTTIELDEEFDYVNFLVYLSVGCNKLDLQTPLIVKNDIFNFAKYNHLKCTASHFVESIDFDYLWIENLNR